MGVPRKECSAVKIWGMITPSAPSQTRTPQESMLSALWEHEKNIWFRAVSLSGHDLKVSQGLDLRVGCKADPTNRNMPTIAILITIVIAMIKPIVVIITRITITITITQ